MKNILIIFSLLTSLLAFTSCQEDIELDIDQAPPVAVIEGLITNIDARQYIKITRTADPYGNQRIRGVSGVTVKVVDSEGNEYAFEEDPDSLGLYLSAFNFAGVVGRSYTMTAILSDGETITATDKMPPQIIVTSSGQKYEEPGPFGDDDEDSLYAAQYDLSNIDNATGYLFSSYRNDTLLGGGGGPGGYFILRGDQLLDLYGLLAPQMNTDLEIRPA